MWERRRALRAEDTGCGRDMERRVAGAARPTGEERSEVEGQSPLVS